jgi:hypothetical protein
MVDSQENKAVAHKSSREQLLIRIGTILKADAPDYWKLDQIKQIVLQEL